MLPVAQAYAVEGAVQGEKGGAGGGAMAQADSEAEAAVAGEAAGAAKAAAAPEAEARTAASSSASSSAAATRASFGARVRCAILGRGEPHRLLRFAMPMLAPLLSGRTLPTRPLLIWRRPLQAGARRGGCLPARGVQLDRLRQPSAQSRSFLFRRSPPTPTTHPRTAHPRTTQPRTAPTAPTRPQVLVGLQMGIGFTWGFIYLKRELGAPGVLVGLSLTAQASLALAHARTHAHSCARQSSPRLTAALGASRAQAAIEVPLFRAAGAIVSGLGGLRRA